MPVSSEGQSTARSISVVLDANIQNNPSDPIRMKRGATKLSVYVMSESGLISNLALKLQVSPDGSIWYDTGKTTLARDHIDLHEFVAKQARMKTTAVQGTSSTARIFFFSS